MDGELTPSRRKVVVSDSAAAAIVNGTLLPAIQRAGGPLEGYAAFDDPNSEWEIEGMDVSLSAAGTVKLVASNDSGVQQGDLTPAYNVGTVPVYIPVKKRAGRGLDVGYTATQASQITVYARPRHYSAGRFALVDPN